MLLKYAFVSVNSGSLKTFIATKKKKKWMAIIKRQQITNVSEDVEKREPSCTLVGM